MGNQKPKVVYTLTRTLKSNNIRYFSFIVFEDGSYTCRISDNLNTFSQQSLTNRDMEDFANYGERPTL